MMNMNLGDHRRDLSVLQSPPYIFRQNSPSTSNSNSNGTFTSSSALTPPSGYLSGGSGFFDPQEQFGLSPPQRPGTAPSSGTQSLSEGYFRPDDRRPSVASVVTNASSTGSKSSIGRSFYSGYKKFFGDGDASGSAQSPGSSESLPPNSMPRSHYGLPRPTTPTGSRPRTPLPSSDVVPFIYQDPEDIRRLGEAPVRDAPIMEMLGFAPEEPATAHSHRLHLHRSKNKDRDRDRERDRDRGSDKELPPRPSSAQREPLGFSGHDYHKGLRLHLDGTASSHSSQTRLIRPGSPTPSIASSLSNNPPKSPGENPPKKPSLWDKIWKKDKEPGGGSSGGDTEKDANTSSTRAKKSNSVDKPTDPVGISTSGISPVTVTTSGAGSGEFVQLRGFDYYPPVEQMPVRKQIIPAKTPDCHSRARQAKKGPVYEIPAGRGPGSDRRGRAPKASEPGTTFKLDADFSNIQDIVKLPGPVLNPDPGPDNSWTGHVEMPAPVAGADITWTPPESWDSDLRTEVLGKPVEDEGENETDGEEDAQVNTQILLFINFCFEHASNFAFLLLLVLHPCIPNGFDFRNLILQIANLCRRDAKPSWAQVLLAR